MIFTSQDPYARIVGRNSDGCGQRYFDEGILVYETALGEDGLVFGDGGREEEGRGEAIARRQRP